jgi:hypothetical protein
LELKVKLKAPLKSKGKEIKIEWSEVKHLFL